MKKKIIGLSLIIVSTLLSVGVCMWIFGPLYVLITIAIVIYALLWAFVVFTGINLIEKANGKN